MRKLFLAIFSIILLYPLYAYAQYGQRTPSEPPASSKILTPSTERPIEIWTFPGTHQLVTGKALTLTVQVIWRLGINVHLDDLVNIDLSPFNVDKVTIGERQIFDNERDYRVVQYILSLPEDAKEGRYTIPSFGVSFVDEVEKREGLATSSPITVKKVPLVITGKVDRDVIEIGDVIRYSLTILYEKDTEILLKNLKEVHFEPFTLLHSSFRHEETPRIKKLLIDYYLSIYEMGGEKRKYEIPSLSVFYFKPTERRGGEEKVIKTKEVRTQPIPVIINKLLKTVDVPLEGLKGPITYKRSELYFQGYFVIFLGISLFLLILAPIGLRRIKDNLFPPQEEPPETPELAAEELRALLSSFRFTGEEFQDKKHLEGIDTALRAYLGSLSGLPREKALALTTSEMLTKMPPEIALPSKEILKGLDMLIFGKGVEKHKAEELIGRIEDILRSALGGVEINEPRRT
ncbi:MAG: hypothetical protein ACE5IC_06030 [Candidatus Brocadiales bacterium]